jgi:hypothetical protein
VNTAERQAKRDTQYEKEEREALTRTVRYGPQEIRDETTEQYVAMPGVFLAAPPRDLPVLERVVTRWGRKRIEEWEDENGKPMARWRWGTDVEVETALNDEETRRLHGARR